MKPLISYYGGKQRIASRVAKYVKDIPHSVFGEAFVGGAALLFALPKRPPNNKDRYREFINDIDGLLVNLYRTAKLKAAELNQLIDATPYSEADYRRAVQMCRHSENFNDLELAWAYYVNVQMSFANKLNGGWGVSVLSQNHAYTWDNKKTNLQFQLDRLAGVYISQGDALDCIRKWDSPHTLVYADPPYVGTDCGHYKGYTFEDWVNLCNLLDESKCSCILSCEAQEVEPRSAQQRIEIAAICSATGAGKVRGDRTELPDQEELGDRSRTEVLWICDRSDQVRSDLHFLKNQQLSIF